MFKKTTIKQLKKDFPILTNSLVTKQGYSSNIDIEIRMFLDALASSIKEYKKKNLNPKKKLPKPLYLAHYTNIDTILSILNDIALKKSNSDLKEEEIKSGKNQTGLRLYAASEMNDPTEGVYLRDEFNKNHPWMDDAKDTPEAFICSFVSSEAEDVADNITYWQAYGKDGLGCSIQPHISDELMENLFPVLYEKEKKIKEAMVVRKNFKPFFDYGEEIHQKLSSTHKEEFATNFRKCFDSIKFLYKHIGYIKEAEYRYVAKSPNGKVLYDANSAGNDLIVRKYTTVPELSASNIFRSKSKIYIGPRVHNSHTVLKYFETLAKEGELYGIEFKLSEIPYRGRK